jgi:hypothetical protein
MDVVKTLQPGKSGAKPFAERYGDDLVAVRYRQDGESHIRFNSGMRHTIQNSLSKNTEN